MLQSKTLIIITGLIIALSGCGGSGNSKGDKQDNTDIGGDSNTTSPNTDEEVNTDPPVTEEEGNVDQADQDNPTLAFFKNGFYNFSATVSASSVAATVTRNSLSEDSNNWVKLDSYWDNLSGTWIEDPSTDENGNITRQFSYRLVGDAWELFEKPAGPTNIRAGENGDIITQPSLAELSLTLAESMDLSGKKIADYAIIKYQGDSIPSAFPEEAAFDAGSQGSYLQLRFNETDYRLNVSLYCSSSEEAPTEPDAEATLPSEGDCKAVADRLTTGSAEDLFSDATHLIELKLLNGFNYFFDVDSSKQVYFYDLNRNLLPQTGTIEETVVNGITLYFIHMPEEYDPNHASQFYFFTEAEGMLVSGTYNKAGEIIPESSRKMLFNQDAIESIKNQFMPIF